MKVIALPRAAGKTYQMVEWARGAPAGEQRVIATFSVDEALRLKRLYSDIEAVSFHSIRDGVLRGRDVVLGIDNLDLLLRGLFNTPVGAISLTPSEEGVPV